MKDRCSPHGWTLDTLEKYLTTRIDAVKENVTTAMLAADKAISKAEGSTEKRFESVNEFRQTLSDQAVNFLSRNEYHANHAALIEKIEGLDKRISLNQSSITEMQSRGLGSKESFSKVGAIVMGAVIGLSTITAIASVLFNVLHR